MYLEVNMYVTLWSDPLTEITETETPFALLQSTVPFQWMNELKVLFWGETVTKVKKKWIANEDNL